jgi:hypothetical protein
VTIRETEMAKDDDNFKDLDENGDGDLLDFDFDEDLLGEETEPKAVESESEEDEDIIELTDVVEEEAESGPVEGEIEGLAELLDEEEEAGEGEEPALSQEEKVNFEEETELRELVEEPAEELGPSPDYSPDEAEEVGEKTVRMERAEQALEEGSEEPFLDLDKEIKLDEGLEELISESELEDLEEPFWDETAEDTTKGTEEPAVDLFAGMPPVEGMAEGAEPAKGGEVLPISEERVEALLTKVVGDVLEKVAKKVIPEVAERVIREEIDALKKSIV